MPWAEYVYNMAFQSTLKETPFKIVYSRDPPSIRSYEPGETRIAAVAQHMADRDAFLEDVRARLEQAQAIYKRFYNKHHRDLTFPVCDWVWLRLRHRAPASLQVKTSSKLRPRFFGSYKIVTIISPVPTSLNFRHGPASTMSSTSACSSRSKGLRRTHHRPCLQSTMARSSSSQRAWCVRA